VVECCKIIEAINSFFIWDPFIFVFRVSKVFFFSIENQIYISLLRIYEMKQTEPLDEFGISNLFYIPPVGLDYT